MNRISKSQIDRLGERLRKGDLSEEDIRELEAYRRSFGDASKEVVQTIFNTTGLQATPRPGKTELSITAKLRRENTMHLSQMQDIAGCRLVVTDILEQKRVVELLVQAFPKSKIIDRLEKPSHGYRAVHIVPAIQGRLVEVQVRTELQHLWAQLSEKLADLLDPDIKYGGGERKVRELLLLYSEGTRGLEEAEAERGLVGHAIDEMLPELPVHLEGKVLEVARQAGKLKADLAEVAQRYRQQMQEVIAHAEAALRAKDGERK